MYLTCDFSGLVAVHVVKSEYIYVRVVVTVRPYQKVEGSCDGGEWNLRIVLWKWKKNHCLFLSWCMMQESPFGILLQNIAWRSYHKLKKTSVDLLCITLSVHTIDWLRYHRRTSSILIFVLKLYLEYLPNPTLFYKLQTRFVFFLPSSWFRILGLVTCKHGGTQWTDGNCYLIQSETPSTWSNAQDSCGTINATLVSIENEEKLRFVQEHVLNTDR